MGVLDGKSAIVSGSARGIGRATAELLASQGAQVLINDLDGDVAEQAAGEIQGETAEFRFAEPHDPTLVLDPADPDVQYVLMPLRV